MCSYQKNVSVNKTQNLLDFVKDKYSSMCFVMKTPFQNKNFNLNSLNIQRDEMAPDYITR